MNSWTDRGTDGRRDGGACEERLLSSCRRPRGAGVSEQRREPMSFRERLPLKKRDQRAFKAPYPYRSEKNFQSAARRVPALHQPWIQSHAPSRSRPHDLSAFRDHRSWAEWRQFNPLHPAWAFSQHHAHLDCPARPPGLRPVSLQGFQRGSDWEMFRDKVSNVRTRDSPPSLSTRLPHSPHDDQSEKDALAQSFIRAPPDALPGPEAASSSSSSSSNHFPWLLPHFLAGSLIELRDGRLRRVEHLQTEDFLLGSLACPDLRLSCCTVQSISPSSCSSSSSSMSRLLILLHDQQSQELVDVYAEYPFFVRGKGWSSCSPQRTARLCGLRCCQLGVGDVCLALTPNSAPRPPPPATPEPEVGSLKAARPPSAQRSAGDTIQPQS